ncbi:hypothetical protein [Nocardia amikacinitolerans]|uniref:hypothetical protein n=1 Tax=Nocardia amikacinitolerans TaxID=756689 RepID=UPI0020A5FBF3|nr:hypothetical protein [Nocardia amikacinitolerans]
MVFARKWWHYTYDAYGRRTTKQHLTNDGTVLERTDYTWDHTHLIEQSAIQGVMRMYPHQSALRRRDLFLRDSANLGVEQLSDPDRSVRKCSLSIAS